jgi:3-oxoadipate enol-lactonase
VSSLTVPGAVIDFDLSGEDASGPVVVQLHGLTSSRTRDRVLGLDLGREFSGRLLRYDARGHGHSTGRPVPHDYVWERLADDLLALLDHVCPGEAVHGVGPSMGTGTLLHAAIREPGRFLGLTLVVPPTVWESRRAQASTYESQAALVEAHGMDALVALGQEAASPPAAPAAPPTQPDVLQELLPSLLRGAALADLPTAEAVAEVLVPTHILAWADDPTHPLSTANALHELLSGSTLTVASKAEEVAAWPALLSAQVLATAGSA